MTGPELSPRDDVGALPGVSATRRDAFRRLGVETIEDLLRLAPRRYEDRRHARPLAELQPGETALVVGRVTRSRAFRTRAGLAVLEAEVADATGSAVARWFYRGFRPQPLPQDRRVALYGRVAALRGDRAEFKAPELERLPPEGQEDPGCDRFVPVHPCTAGLSARVVRRAVWEALPAAARMHDPVPAALRGRHGLPPLREALCALHFPGELHEAERARRRLAFDELLVHELLLARRRAARARIAAPAIPFSARIHERIRARLPFDLTPGQQHVVAEIVSDLEQPRPMYRLLQGDVGSGKTAVAVYALLGVVARGLQAAFMAPTEVLARQHAATLQSMLAGSRVRIEALAGGRRGRDRAAVLGRVAQGEIDVLVGTHAVLGDDVRFRDLGLVIVDEQHKFGVRQRRGLVAKGSTEAGWSRPHCLVMTATPIPRTLALTVWGDMDLSLLQGRIPGRVPVETWVVRPREARRVMRRVRAELGAGRQVYVIYPLVEESDKLALKDAHVGRDRWVKALPQHRVGLLHGRMKRDEKETVMQAFREGHTHVLVATVVIEVGVDVPNATMLVVEHAERFGLSQLHQLRGRIGRGAVGGLCVLVDRSRAGTPARLEVLAKDHDGFRIAEEDLKLRGLGDLFGTRQHGRPAFHAASLPRDLPVLVAARRAAGSLASEDPRLEAPAHAALASAVEARAARSEA